jgi:hypothetical protein
MSFACVTSGDAIWVIDVGSHAGRMAAKVVAFALVSVAADAISTMLTSWHVSAETASHPPNVHQPPIPA